VQGLQVLPSSRPPRLRHSTLPTPTPSTPPLPTQADAKAEQKAAKEDLKAAREERRKLGVQEQQAAAAADKVRAPEPQASGLLRATSASGCH